ncbi:hypothetical protein B0T22DRAFT_213507 [Podospora appendiculata]|uniref:Ubiquitin-like protease family profile domain-containing protein n=1 Tax=Podospora appendiculata TaxID=314037 RepID=A0AAE0X4W3_9PEZI|nr:hypothetical protein B0T22DRAFT_213507 [Podospora appendiculata]
MAATLPSIADPRVQVDLRRQPSQAELDAFRLPECRDISELAGTQLYDINDYEFGHVMTTLEPDSFDGLRARQFIHRTYSRVRHPVIDETDEHAYGHEAPAQEFMAFRSCHIGLRDIETRGEYPTGDAIYHLGHRVLSWLQNIPHAPIMQRDDWFWIPQAYMLSNAQTPLALADPELVNYVTEMGDRSGDRAPFGKARFTLHLVHYSTPKHYALIIRQASTGNRWYLDTLRSTRKKHNEAFSMLDTWLTGSGVKKPPRAKSRVVETVPLQEDDRSCGFQTIANAIVFVCFGCFGWNNISHWRDGEVPNNRRMLRELKTCLNALMGRRWTAPQLGPGEASRWSRYEVLEEEKEMQIRRIEEERKKKEQEKQKEKEREKEKGKGKEKETGEEAEKEAEKEPEETLGQGNDSGVDTSDEALGITSGDKEKARGVLLRIKDDKKKTAAKAAKKASQGGKRQRTTDNDDGASRSPLKRQRRPATNKSQNVQATTSASLPKTQTTTTGKAKATRKPVSKATDKGKGVTEPKVPNAAV